jgi:hypothetical protein
MGYFLLKEKTKNFVGQEFNKGEILYRIEEGLYVDPRNSLRRLPCAPEKFGPVFSEENLNTVLSIVKGFLQDDEKFAKLLEIVDKRVASWSNLARPKIKT